MYSNVPKRLVLIGASTGGPGQIQKIITSLPTLKKSTLIIAQHMVKGFHESFASRLQSETSNKISIIEDRQKLNAGEVYIAELHTRLNTQNFRFEKEESSSSSFNPNINTLFHSFASIQQDIEILCVILTGIGEDGVEGCQTLTTIGARCITETQESAIVDGMPFRARELIKDIEVYDIHTIIKKISEFCDV